MILKKITNNFVRMAFFFLLGFVLSALIATTLIMATEAFAVGGPGVVKSLPPPTPEPVGKPLNVKIQQRSN